MTKPITDASTAVAEAIANKFMFGDGYTSGVYACIAYRIYYNGATFTVDTAYGTRQSASDVTAVWDAVNYKLDIDLSGLDNVFTYAPVAVVSAFSANAHATGPRYIPQCNVTSATDANVRFINPSSMTAYATTVDPAMAFYIIFVGQIGA